MARFGSGSVAARLRVGIATLALPGTHEPDLSSASAVGHHGPMADPAIVPVQTPDEYRRELLDMLGGEDPATVQAATVRRWRELVRRA